MNTLQPLVQKQDKRKKRYASIQKIQIVVLSLLTLFVFTFCFLFFTFHVIFSVLLIIATAVAFEVAYRRYYNKLDKEIIDTISDILYSNVSIDLLDDEQAIVTLRSCTKDAFYFSIEVFSNNITYDYLVTSMDSIVNNINEVINEKLCVFYYINMD